MHGVGDGTADGKEGEVLQRMILSSRHFVAVEEGW